MLPAERKAVLRGRDRELTALREMLTEARNRRGAAMVVVAEPGMGKTALLNALQAETTGFLLLATAGVEAESSFQGAGLHRLLQPLAERIATMPPRHAQVLSGIVADSGGEPAGQFELCSAVHRVLVDVGYQQPVLCIVDDLQWLDRSSLEALAFAARRVAAAPLVTVFAGHPPAGAAAASDPLAGIPRLRLNALDDDSSLWILRDLLPDGIPADLAAELVDVASGNPLALAEFAGSLTAEQLCGAAPAPSSLPPHSRIRCTIMRRFGQLSPDARRLVMMAVVEEQFDVDTVLQAAMQVGIDLRALDEAKASGLVVIDGDTVTVPSLLVRTVLHAEASLAERRAAHNLLADVLDEDRDRIRWTWHRAATTGAPCGDIADEIGEAAVVARKSGDYVGSSAAYQRAAALTPETGVKARRLILAARDAWLGGRTARSRALLRRALPLSAGPDLRGLADLLRGVIELRDGLPAMANQSLQAAARQLTEVDHTHAITALMLAGEASCLAGDYAAYSAVAHRAAQLRRPVEPPVASVMFDHFEGMAATYEGRHADATKPLLRAVRTASVIDDVTSKILASHAAYTLGDAAVSLQLATQAVSGARRKGLVTLTPWARRQLSISAILLDQHSTAVSNSLDGLREAQAIGQQNVAVGHLAILALLAALQGDRDTVLLRLDAAATWAARRALSQPSTLGSWALACVDLANDRPADAMDRLRLAAAGAGRVHLAIRVMSAPHFVEAAARCGQRATAEIALGIFDRWVGNSGCAPRLALSHRCHALLADREEDADEHFREAIRLHRSSETALELAKTELFYAYQLRRSRKPTAARQLLRDAVKIFEHYDAPLWAERATAELRAAGESVKQAASRPVGELTPQQLHIARLVSEGATNREIASQLLVSHRTVEHHLRNIFAKLGVRSRVELTALFR